jgi:hypothetical protein
VAEHLAAEAAPPRRLQLCIDFTSPWSAESIFSTPVATSVSPSQPVQNATSLARSPARSSAWALPGAVCARAAAT